MFVICGEGKTFLVWRRIIPAHHFHHNIEDADDTDEGLWQKEALTEAAFFYFNLKLTLAYSQEKSGFPSQKVSLSCALRYFIVQEDLYEMM